MLKQHIIFTNGRSGSNFIANTLNLHPEIVNIGEVLGEWTFPYKIYRHVRWLQLPIESYINAIYSSSFIYYAAQIISAISHVRKRKPVKFKLRHKIKSFGIKDFSFLIERRDLESWLINSSDIKVIYLYRENILKRYLSLIMMNQTGIVKSESTFSKKTIHVDINEMLSELDIYNSQLEYEKYIVNQISPNRIMKLRYEDYFLNNKMNEETQEVFRFLGVEPIAFTSGQKKLNADNLEELIENYSEVSAALAKTNYYKYLEI